MKKNGLFLLSLMLILVVPLAGCLGGTKRTVASDDTTVSTDKSLVVGLTQSGSGALGSSTPAPASSPSRVISGLSKSDIKVYKDASTTALSADSYVWDPVNNRISIPEAGKATYTIEVARAARFSVPSLDDRETFAQAVIPEAVGKEDAGTASAYVKVGVKVTEYKKKTDADTNGTFISYYKYYSESKVESDKKFSTTFTGSAVSFYKWSDVGETSEVSTTSTSASKTSIGTVTDGAVESLTSTNLGTDYAYVTTKDELESALASSTNLMKTDLTTLASFLSVLTGQTVSGSTTSILDAISKSSVNKLEIVDIIALRSLTAVNAATESTTSDSDLDYGDTAYFAIITKAEETVTSHTMQVSAVINSNTSGTASNVVWASSDTIEPSTVVGVPLVTGQTDVWGYTLFRMPVTTSNSKDGVLKLNFIINDRGLVEEVEKTYTLKSGTTTPSTPTLAVYTGKASAASGANALIPSDYDGNTIATVDRNVYMMFHVTEATSSTGKLYLKVTSTTNAISTAMSKTYSLFPTLSSTWTDSKVTDRSGEYYGLDLYEYYEIPLSEFTEDTSEFNISATSSAPGIALFYDTTETAYGIRIVKPTGANHDPGSTAYSAYVKGSAGIASSEASGTLVTYGGDYTVTTSDIDPEFSLYWGKTAHGSLAAADLVQGTVETGTYYLYMKAKSTAAGSDGTPGSKDLMFYVNVSEDGTDMHGFDGAFLHSDSSPNADTLYATETDEVVIKTVDSSTVYVLNRGLVLDETKKYVITVKSLNVMSQVYEYTAQTLDEGTAPVPGTVVVDFTVNSAANDLDYKITTTGLTASSTVEVRLLKSETTTKRWPAGAEYQTLAVDSSSDISFRVGNTDYLGEIIDITAIATGEEVTMQVRAVATGTAFRSDWVDLAEFSRLGTPDSANLTFTAATNKVTGSALTENAYYYVYKDGDVDNGIIAQALDDGGVAIDAATVSSSEGIAGGQSYSIMLLPSENGKLASIPSTAKASE